MDIKNSIFVEDSEEFPWDEKTLHAFRRVIKDQGINCRMDDIFLLGFLRARKFDIQRSLQLLKNYHKVRIEHPQYFRDLLPSKLEHALPANTVQLLPKPDQNGRFMCIYEFSKWDPSVANANDILRALILSKDLLLNFHRTQVNSIVIIIDAAGLSLSHFLQASPRLINSMVKIVFRDSYQLRYKEIHYVNLNVIIKAVLTVLVPLLPSKLKKRLHFHSDMSTLHEFISPECLPVEYGGTLPTVDPTEATKMIKDNEEFYRINEEYLKSYEEQSNKNFNEGKFRYVGEDCDDEKLKEFIEKSERKHRSYSGDPEAFITSLSEESEIEITPF